MIFLKMIKNYINNIKNRPKVKMKLFNYNLQEKIEKERVLDFNKIKIIIYNAISNFYIFTI